MGASDDRRVLTRDKKFLIPMVADCNNMLQCQDLQLIHDVNTRWSSTYLMIKRALDLQDVSI